MSDVFAHIIADLERNPPPPRPDVSGLLKPPPEAIRQGARMIGYRDADGVEHITASHVTEDDAETDANSSD